jgi:hypothetical protein
MSAFHRLGALLTATAMDLASSILVPPPVRGSPNWAALAQSLTSSERSPIPRGCERICERNAARNDRDGVERGVTSQTGDWS